MAVVDSPDALVADLLPGAQRMLTPALTHCYELVMRGIMCQCPRPDVFDLVDATAA